MKNENGKYSFWRIPGFVVLGINALICFLFGSILCPVAIILEKDNLDLGILVLSAMGAILLIITFILFLFMGFRVMFLKVEIDSEKIIVKWLFGKMSEISINEITEVGRIGNYLVIKDSRQKQGFIEPKKKGYILFKENKERLTLVQSFWAGNIVNVYICGRL